MNLCRIILYLMKAENWKDLWDCVENELGTMAQNPQNWIKIGFHLSLWTMRDFLWEHYYWIEILFSPPFFDWDRKRDTISSQFLKKKTISWIVISTAILKGVLFKRIFHSRRAPDIREVWWQRIEGGLKIFTLALNQITNGGWGKGVEILQGREMR